MPSSPSSLLGLIWLASPALPVGGFSYSEGFEAAVEAGLVHDEATARIWLEHQLELSLARSELPLVVQAHAAWQACAGGAADADPSRPADEDPEARVAALNTWQRVTREGAESRAQTEQMGRSLLAWLRNGDAADDRRIAVLAALQPAPTWPIAFALAGLLAGADRRDSGLAFGFGWAENMVQAAMKAVPLGQASAQRILAALTRTLPSVVARADEMPDTARQAFAPRLAVLSARHETQYSRLFRS